MRYLFILHKDHFDLACAEAKALFGPGKIDKNRLEIETGYNDFSRLAYTRQVLKAVDSDWNDIIEGTYSVKGSKELQDRIWESLDDPKVNLKSPDTTIVEIDGFVGKEMPLSRPDFNDRRAHLRPNHYPASLHPKLARAMVNLTALREGKILDPFCGTGGILIEAGLLGFELFGQDISTKMIEMSKENLDYYGVSADLSPKDAADISGKYDAIVTELPFGRNTKVAGELKDLYERFLKAAYLSTDRMVVSFPEIEVDLCGWKVENEFSVYLHKSLTKKVLTLIKDL